MTRRELMSRTALLAALPEIAPPAEAQSGTAEAVKDAVHRWTDARAALTEHQREFEDRTVALERGSLEGQPAFRLRRLAAHWLTSRLDVEAAERVVLDAERRITAMLVAEGDRG